MMKLSSLLLTALSGVTFAQTDLILEDFQSGIPANYTIVDNDGRTPAAAVSEFTEAWITTTDPDDNANQVAAATSYFDPIGQASRWLITPQLTLGAYGNYLQWMAKSHDASFSDSYQVLLSSTDNALTSFTDTLLNVANEGDQWTPHTMNLSEEGYDNQSVYIAFVLRTYDGFKLYLDSLHIWKEDPVSVNALDGLALTTYPNPFNDHIFIQSSLPVENLTLRTVNGQVVLTRKDVPSLETSTLPTGVYFLEVKTAAGTVVRKMIKR